MSRGGIYVSGGAPEILDRLKQLNNNKTTNLNTARAKASTMNEESSRQVFGVSEFSSRNLVNEMSPNSRFKE